MKRILTSLLVAAGIAGSTVPFLAAQTSREIADVPFSFVVGNQILPAGKYTVSHLNLGAPLFEINDGSKHSALIQLGVNELRESTQPSLTFVCYGTECILAKVDPGSGNYTYSVGDERLQRSLHRKVNVAALISVKLTHR